MQHIIQKYKPLLLQIPDQGRQRHCEETGECLQTLCSWHGFASYSKIWKSGEKQTEVSFSSSKTSSTQQWNQTLLNKKRLIYFMVLQHHKQNRIQQIHWLMTPIVLWIKKCLYLSVCLCEHHDWFSSRSTGPTEMKLGVQIPWDTRILRTYSTGNTFHWVTQYLLSGSSNYLKEPKKSLSPCLVWESNLNKFTSLDC